MQAVRSILVVIDPEHSESLALKRAKLIAGVTQAHLHLLVCDPKHDHNGMLGVLKAALLADGYSVTTEQAWNQSLHQTIVDVQQAEGCGLVVKQHFPDSRTVIFPHIGHQFSIGCLYPILADFVERGTTKGLDTTRCDGAVGVPPFELAD